MKDYKRHTVTTALPYANGPVHIGHLAGVYVPADIYVRDLRSKGVDVMFIGGSDEHGVPITLKARKEGTTPQAIVDRYHSIIKKSFEDFGISFDIYSRTSSKTHAETSSQFFLDLYKKGKFITKTEAQYYDEEAKQFLADRYITGTCPHCGNPKAYGDQCEKCGTSLSAKDLIDPKSAISGNAPILKETTHWYLPLEDYEPWLREWILEGHKEWKVNVYGQCKSWIDAGLHPRAVTRDLDWGVKVPLEEAKGKVLYVWFDAPIGYISASKDLKGDDWEKYWKSDDTRLIHFIGKDNIVFHCIIFPCMLKAEGSYILPDNVPAFEFLNLEGDKISTSRNWAVWLHEYLLDFPGKQDVLRYVLSANAPETKDNDFTWKDFQTKNNSELVAIFGNLVNRTMVLIKKYFNGIVPAKGELTDVDKETIKGIVEVPGKIAESLENFHFRDSLSEMMNLARLGNKYLTETEPWKIYKTDPATLYKMLNFEKKVWKDAGSADLIEAGHVLAEPELLFEKIEDSAVEAQIARLQETKRLNELNAPVEISPQKAETSFDDFSKMDLRVGKILEAETVPKANKLLKLLIDTGIDKRTIVSGIAEYYKPEEIIGKSVCVLVNLAPRKLKGVVSNGMILMAQNPKGGLCFVSPVEDFNPGSEIK